MAEKKLTLQQFQEWGSKGGSKTKKLGKKHYSNIGKKGAAIRWAGHTKKSI